jgi:hypothetical protein
MKYNMSDDFREHEDMRVPLPIQNETKLVIPELFIQYVSFKTGNFEREENGKFKKIRVPHKNRRTGEITYKMEKIPIMKNGWTIADISGNDIINRTRQISSRDNHPVLKLKTSKIGKITETPHYIPRLADFPRLSDRKRIFEYLTHLHPDEEQSFPENKTRGLPPILPANWEHHNLGAFPKNYIVKEKKKKEVSHEDIFGSDTESESDEEEPVIPFAKKQKTKGEGIDFEEIKWNTFKALYNRFLKKNPDFKDKIEDLEHFAHFVISNPEKFSKIANKKAQFYVNFLEKK